MKYGLLGSYWLHDILKLGSYWLHDILKLGSYWLHDILKLAGQQFQMIYNNQPTKCTQFVIYTFMIISKQ
jgi:hypothetical protein